MFVFNKEYCLIQMSTLVSHLANTNDCSPTQLKKRNAFQEVIPVQYLLMNKPLASFLFSTITLSPPAAEFKQFSAELEPHCLIFNSFY